MALDMGIITLIIVLMLIAIFEIIMKAIALWRSARAGHRYWFIFILIFNTAGILPLIYIIFFEDKKAKKRVK